MQLGVISSRTGKGDNKSEVPVTSKEQRFSSSLSQSFKDDVVGNSSCCCWADTVATHCPSRPSQLLVNNHSKTLRQSGWKPLYYVAEDPWNADGVAPSDVAAADGEAESALGAVLEVAAAHLQQLRGDLHRAHSLVHLLVRHGFSQSEAEMEEKQKNTV